MLEANEHHISGRRPRTDLGRLGRRSPGKLHLIIGPNGAGKSTLIKVLARLLRPQTGAVEYDGVDMHDVERSGARKAPGRAFPGGRGRVSADGPRGRDDGPLPAFRRPSRPVDEKIVDEMMEFFDVREFATATIKP